ncbi:unnamed protein product, partial [Iphiclides podalirius]
MERPPATAIERDQLVDTGIIWKHNIKKFGGAFRASMIESFQETFNNHSRRLVESLKAECNGAPLDIQHKYLAKTTFRAVCETTLGVISSEDLIDEKFFQAFIRITELMAVRLMNILLHSDTVYRLTSSYKEFDSCIRTVNNVVETVIFQKVCDMESKTISNKKVQKGVYCRKSAALFLDVLLELMETDSTLTEEQIKQEVTTILLAGHETTASALNFIFLMLGCNLDVQRKLHEEIQNLFGDSKRAVLKEDLNKLVYCEAVILETLRLYPPVPCVLRYVDHDLQLRTTCAFNIWGSGHSKRVWGPDALLYRPERWLDPSMTPKQASAFLSFSAGKRVCIGKRLTLNLGFM